MIRTTAFVLIVLSLLAKRDCAGQLAQDQQMSCSDVDQRMAFRSVPDTVASSKAGPDGLDLRVDSEVQRRRWVYVIVHHSATKTGSVESIHEQHAQRRDSQGNFWLGIGYHFVIGNGRGMPDGSVEATFRWRQQLHGAHSGSAVHNANGIGICLIGDFEKQPPTRRQTDSVTRLIQTLTEQHDIPARLVIGHRTVKPTACPGRLFPLEEVVQKAVTVRKALESSTLLTSSTSRESD